VYQRVFFGPLHNEKNRGLPDLNLREWLVMAPLLVFMLWLGVAPRLVLDKVETSLDLALRPVLERVAAPAVEE
jgi:NADH-quinone oxidoreductase subunit M